MSDDDLLDRLLDQFTGPRPPRPSLDDPASFVAWINWHRRFSAFNIAILGEIARESPELLPTMFAAMAEYDDGNPETEPFSVADDDDLNADFDIPTRSEVEAARSVLLDHRDELAVYYDRFPDDPDDPDDQP